MRGLQWDFNLRVLTNGRLLRFEERLDNKFEPFSFIRNKYPLVRFPRSVQQNLALNCLKQRAFQQVGLACNQREDLTRDFSGVLHSNVVPKNS